MKWIGITILLLVVLSTAVFAVDFNQQISDEDKEQFDNILQPIMRIYNLVKYALSVLAVLFLLFAAGTFIISGKDQAKRESAKTMMVYVIIGLVIIWVAPLIVSFMVG
ncbi:MAG: pilin [Candidatus Woesearchaeota archaeon]